MDEKRTTRKIDVCLACESFHTSHTDGYLKEDVPDRQRQVVDEYWPDATATCSLDVQRRPDHTKPLSHYIKMTPAVGCPNMLEHLVIPKRKRDRSGF